MGLPAGASGQGKTEQSAAGGAMVEEGVPVRGGMTGEGGAAAPRRADGGSGEGGGEGGEGPAGAAAKANEPYEWIIPMLVVEPNPHGPVAIDTAKRKTAGQIKVEGEAKCAAWCRLGYRLARATHGVAKGSWYCELAVLEPKAEHVREAPHHPGVRVGWANHRAEINAPVGYDRFGYAVRSRDGAKFNKARGEAYGKPFGPGDVVGLAIHLPEDSKPYEPPEVRELRVRSWTAPKMPKPREPEPHPASYIEYFLNGVSLGKAFTDVLSTTYYPAVSLYMGASAEFRFHPNAFSHTPPAGFAPLSELETVRPPTPEPEPEPAVTDAGAPVAMDATAPAEGGDVDVAVPAKKQKLLDESGAVTATTTATAPGHDDESGLAVMETTQ
ncbi:uncharacterized protein AMSG_00229 [Thecamonas trahens ATCC 50062]|uniref:SPRY domain-containing protein n=1 Tax=Thecamonas trahens ATCC 50062 TaxID=461836 RepID=A0A0L0D1N3_THETB|nr:hypothetical protein AMSG_00229 [Thecamonas trahens ATCC 50062]KNC46111.1 hypothetical protein AMSG_00229 [Thecamonas trahens ATCC 50062]|eukprot:XP_013763088.1 hypothetical protein AMSG_00229 [Thecamonas trahens ATCC 50062]